MRNNFWFWEAAISPERCDEIIEECKKVPAQKGTTFADVDKGYIADGEVRNSTVRWVQNVPGITETIWPYVWEANRMAYNFDIASIFDVQFTEYDAAEEQYYSWHHDVDFVADRGYDRKISAVIQLSDQEDYEGGEFQFRYMQAPEGFKKRGSVLTFPSYLEHQVTPVTEGTRYSLVTWVEGPRWR